MKGERERGIDWKTKQRWKKNGEKKVVTLMNKRNNKKKNEHRKKMSIFLDEVL